MAQQKTEPLEFTEIKVPMSQAGAHLFRWKDGDEIRALESHDIGVEALYETLATLAGDICNPTGIKPTDMVVTGATFYFEKEGGKAVTLKASKKLKGYSAPLNINMPKQTPSKELSAKLVVLQGHATDYVNGVRSQQSLDV